MNKKRYNQIIHEAYENYSKALVDSITFSERYKHFRVNGLEFNSGYPNYIHFTKEEFINKCKTDPEFSEKWGLKIEERELSLEERNDYYTSNYKGLDCESHEELNKLGDIPTKLITITYNNEKIEVYE